MIRFSYYTLVMFLLIGTASGQSGYLGKRASIHIGFENIIASKIYQQNADSIQIYEAENIWFRFFKNMQINYAISRREELAMGLVLLNSSFLLDSIYQFHGKTWYADYRLYEKVKGSIAPIGQYISAGIIYHDARYARGVGNDGRAQSFGLSAGIGIQRAFKERWLFNASYKAWLPIKNIDNRLPSGIPFEQTPTDYLYQLSKSSLVSFQFRVGILLW